MTTIEVLKFLADAADEVLVNIYDANQDRDEETGEEYPDCRRLRIAERLARRQLRQDEVTSTALDNPLRKGLIAEYNRHQREDSPGDPPTPETIAGWCLQFPDPLHAYEGYATKSSAWYDARRLIVAALLT